MAQHLDRARPLWELYVLNGLEDGRIGIFAKTHHAMIDGVAGVDVATLLLDESRTPRERITPVWTPRPAPSRARLFAGAVAETVLRPVGALLGAGRALRHPRRLVGETLTDVEGLAALAWTGLHPAPACGLNVPIGPNRRLVTVRESLADFRAIKERLGGTVNDVVLAAVCGALRRWLAARGELTEDMELHAMVPVSIRVEQDGEAGNHVSTILAPLPVGEEHVRRRYVRISEGVRHARRSHQVIGADLLMQLSGYAPPTIVAQIARLQNAQRFFNLSVTNIPGPQQPLYAMGARLLRFVPFTPLPANMALIVAVLSYDGHMEFGLTVDVEAIPDVDVIADGLTAAVDELEEAAGLASRGVQACAGP
jgi:WS/DGAT/MGAT family acyltransferase